MNKIPLNALTVELESGSRPKGGVSEKSGTIPSLGAEHLDGNGGFLFEKIKYISQTYFQSMIKGRIQPNDILIVKDGATTGKISYVSETFPFKKASINEHLFRLVSDSTKLVQKYLFYFLSSNYGQKQILSDFRGATVGGISRSFLDKVNVPVVAIQKQKRIVEILDNADALRQKRKQALALLDEFLRSLFWEMFGDVVRNTKNFKKERFDSVTESRLGKMLDSKQQKGKYLKPYIRNTNVQWNRIDLTELLEMDFNEKDQIEFRLRFGDILICEGGEVGRTAIWKDNLEECYFQKAIHRIRPNLKKILPEYIVQLMWFYANYGGFKDFVTSATIAHLTGIKLKSIKIPIPPIDLQTQFAKIVEQTEATKAKMQQSLQEMDNQFQALMQRAFKGEL